MAAMGLTYVTVVLKSSLGAEALYRAQFLVDSGATDSMAPQGQLLEAGIRPVGKTTYELADGEVRELEFGLATIEFMGEVTSGRVVFGPDDSEPLLGVTALESVGIVLDPANKTLKRLPAISLK